MSTYSPAFISLSFILTEEFRYTEKDVNDKYTYFSKNGKPTIQLHRLKTKYTNLELSSYANRVGQSSELFIKNFNMLVILVSTRMSNNNE